MPCFSFRELNGNNLLFEKGNFEMKKRVLSIMLALCLCMSLLPVTAMARLVPAHTNHCVCGGSVTTGEHGHTCNTVTEWQPLDLSDTDTWINGY